MAKLNVGDYGMQFEDGHKPPVFFERKSIPDLFGTLGGGYSRFKREIIRAQDSKVSLIVLIEGSFSKVLKGAEYSKMSGISVMRRLFTIWVRYGVSFVCLNSRTEMAQYIMEAYYCMGKEYIRKKGK